jgi:hypothetical protein
VRRSYIVVNYLDYRSDVPYFDYKIGTFEFIVGWGRVFEIVGFWREFLANPPLQDTQLLGKDCQKGRGSGLLTVFVADCTFPFNS